MKKEEVLSKSREENKDQDLYAIEIQAKAGNVIALTALALATLFFVIQSVLGLGFNFGLYAIVFSIGAAGFIFKAVHMRRRRDVVFSVIYTAATIVLAVIYIYQLASAAAMV